MGWFGLTERFVHYTKWYCNYGNAIGGFHSNLFCFFVLISTMENGDFYLKTRHIFTYETFVQSAIGEMQLQLVCNLSYRNCNLLYRTWKIILPLAIDRGG